MIPVTTPAAMEAFDDAHRDQLDQLIAAAGWQVARQAIAMLGGSYGRRIVVIAGPGNNGADGRVAARLLRARGVRVGVVDPGASLGGARPDLVIDAAFGTGLSRPYVPGPVDPAIPVLAVDVPSGLDGLTGEAVGEPLRADRTVTFVAAKPGLFLGDGPSHCGEVVLADLGFTWRGGADPHTDIGLLTAADAATWWPQRDRSAHKWNHAVWVIGGSPTMPGAPRLAALGAQRSGASYVRVSVPGVADAGGPIETVGWPLDAAGWGSTIASASERIAAVVIGPGLGRDASTLDQVRASIAGLVEGSVPTVVDADGLGAVVGTRLAPSCVVTPHDGEFQTLTNRPVPADRLLAVRQLAKEMNATVLLKGPTTVVAAPHGPARFVTSGDARLATAGSGDVLSGMIAALLSYGLEPLDAASLAAWVHGRAGRSGPRCGMTAADIAEAIPTAVLCATSG